MEGKGPYRIYDPGGGTPEEASAAFERLVEENTKLKEKMQGIKSLGELLEESQLEASRLRQKVEDLVKDNEMLRSTSSLDKLAEIAGGVPDRCSSPVAPSEAQKELEKVTQKPSSSGSSSEFEIVGAEEKRSSQGSSRKSDTEPLQNEDIDLMLHLQRLENTLSVFAEESDKTQLFAHLGRMALEFNRLSSKVHKNEQKTSILQVRRLLAKLLALCEQLRNENEELRAKLEKELEQRNQASEKLRCENLELRKMVMMGSKEGMKGEGIESAGKQQGAVVEKATGKNVLGTSEKKVKILEHQRNELLEVNKQWDHHFRSMKQQYEQKITDLRQKLADSQKAQGELETEREHKQRDFDRKLLLAKSKIEEEEAERERLNGEVKDLKQRVKFLQDQLAPVTRQREYQEKEILRLNKALEEALNFQASAASAFNSPIEPSMSIRHQEVMTQNELLKQQVKIFEEDFQRERSDRERMNEEKEALKQQLEKVQKQLMLTNNQLRIFKEDYQKEKEEKDKLKKLLKQHKQHSGDRLHPEPQPGPVAPVCPMYQFPCSPPGQPHIYHGYEDWQQIRYPPSPMANERPVQNYHRFPPPEYTWCQPCVISQNQNSQAVDGVKQLAKESDPTALGLPKSQRPT
ncbi:TNFAIP3-interacting protein 1 isoform X1 [Hemicordylus capensis]|uniref:TNFAIP3-interacting protein 1 isoform X1 n=1 Tax=Hemicordylus capensis TaxID=884348 RepID=UPI002303BC82|nr:TNFAIP3-interacting protein 1 isoform X1 [Hemicordylus capensis]XP_053152640.1 TNFAIP3-interacting protein 1 isoform X1 [Hemicordylus capensis]